MPEVFTVKNIPLKIFTVVLIAGIVGISGMIILKNDIEDLSDGYRVITDEYSENKHYTLEIRTLLYRHQALVANHTAADSEEKYSEYESAAEKTESSLRDMFDELGGRMKSGDKSEKVYHKAYSSFISYLQNAEIAFGFSRGGSKATADYYIVNVMDGYVEKVNASLDALDGYTEEEIVAAQNVMDGHIRTSTISAIVCISSIAVSVAVYLAFCVRITSNLEKYKDALEKDVERKSEALREHSEKMLRIQNNTIIGMANLIESRDGDTGEHVKRTSRYVSMLASAAKESGYCADILTDGYIELLSKAAPMHDIGKISVPDSILQKPGKLTGDEFESIKSHAAEGGRIIRDVMSGIEEKDYIDIAADVASCHHEKWDGTGYPLGLSGGGIPLCARIMAIADVFDALISKRCYKESMPLDEAFGIIGESAGTHFDPTLAELFLGLRNDIESYLKNMAAEN